MSHRPRRALGQNFLVDPRVRARLVEEARVGPGDTVLEIGPGRGALTEGLARTVEEEGGRLILVELDAELAEGLSERYRNRPRVEVIQGDILDCATADLVPDPGSLRVVGNIPYNLTSPILFHLLRPPRPREVLLMVQAEVADRILSDPGTKAYGALTVGVRSVAEVERVLRVPSGAFRPRPKVDSTVVRIRPANPSPMSPAEERALRGLTRAVFQWRRKQLGKTLREHPDLRLGTDAVDRLLAAARVHPTARPEEVAPSGFVAMARAVPPGTELP